MMKGKWKPATLAVLALLAIPATRALGQGVISGRITGQVSGQPLAEARVLVIGTALSATSGEDGRFTLRNVPNGSAQIQVLRVGYQSQKKTVEVAPGAPLTADFAMQVAVAQLDEVVTTATGQQRRVELGNALSTLGNVTTRVEESQTRDMGALLVAKAPGVVVLPAVMTGGAPTIRIRGLSSISLTNAPIYIVDGIRYDAGTSSLNGQTSFSMLNSLSPDEIEDIEIVKGPSAATLYGTNASNGVVVVTTRKGRAGNAKWTFIGERGEVQDRNAYQTMYANFGHRPGTTGPAVRCKLPTMVTAKNPGGDCISDSISTYNLMKDQDRTFVKDQPRSLYGVNVSGGSDVLRYFISSEIDDEIGPIEMPAFEIARFNAQHIDVRKEWLHPEAATKMNFRSNLSAALSPTLDVNVSAGFARNENRIPPSGSAFEALYYIGMQNYGYKGCPGGAPPCGLDKSTMSADSVALNEFFQFAPGDVMQRFRPQIVQRTTMSLNGNWRPLSWFQNDATIGIDLANRDNSDLCRKGECAPTSTNRQGLVADAKNNRRTVSAKLSSTASYNARSWLNLRTTVGGDYVNVEDDGANSSGSILPPGGSVVDQASTRNGGQLSPVATKTLGIYAQEQAGLRDRLFFTLAVRSDQNSAFGTKFQHVVYPKASLSWMMSDEPFFPQWSFLNSFRLRTAYGASGVQPGRTDALVTFTAGSQNLPSRTPGATSGTDTPALAANRTGNPDLRPERTYEYEAGFETQLLSNKVRLDYTTYLKRTSDALINVDRAPSSGASELSPLVNIGATENTGHEVSLTAQLLERSSFAWDVTINASHESNKIRDLGINPVTGESRILNEGSGQQQRVGYPINGRWGRPYSYSDANGDGILQPNEVVVDPKFVFFGYAFPRDIFSVQNSISLFKNQLRLTGMVDYKGGFTLQDGGNNFQCGTGPFACREVQDPTAPLAWQARNVAKIYGTVVDGTSYKTSVGYLQNGQFWKFREFSAAYTLPPVVRRYIRAQSGSTVVFGVRNLHTWTGYTGVDPEEHDAPSDTQSNFQSSPAPRYMTLRFNLKY
jgi:TonB-linked SusC/RagA family outer membrane protein